MKLRHLPFAGALALAACPGPQQMGPTKPAQLTPLQKKLPEPVELVDPKQLDAKEGKVLVLEFDSGSKRFLGYQVDPSTCTVRHAYKIDPGKLGDLLVPSYDPAGQIDIYRPPSPPPPPPNGDDKLAGLVNHGARLYPGGTCQAFEPNGPNAPVAPVAPNVK